MEKFLLFDLSIVLTSLDVIFMIRVFFRTLPGTMNPSTKLYFKFKLLLLVVCLFLFIGFTVSNTIEFLYAAVFIAAVNSAMSLGYIIDQRS